MAKTMSKRSNRGGGSLFTPNNLSAAIRTGNAAYKAALSASRYIKNYTKTPPKGVKKNGGMPTPKNKRPYKGGRSYGKGSKPAASSKSAGFFPTGSTKFRSDPAAIYMKKGVVRTTEKNDIVTGDQSVYIGHSTKVAHEELKLISLALAKHLLRKDGLLTTSMAQPINMNVPFRVIMVYYEDSTTTAQLSSTLAFSGTATPEDVGDSIYEFFNQRMDNGEAEFSGVSMNLEKEYSDLTFVTSTRVDLTCCYVNTWAKSDLKIQNRTTNDAEERTDVVDNVPLYGKTYSGKGAGVVLKGNRTTPYLPFIANEAHGAIVGSDGAQYLQDPPNGLSFMGVGFQGKAKLEPGEIKTSTLVSYMKNSLNKYLAKLNRVGTGWDNNLHRLYTDGKFKMMGLEKMIDVDAATNVVCAYEVNLKLGAYINESQNSITQPLFQTNP